MFYHKYSGVNLFFNFQSRFSILSYVSEIQGNQIVMWSDTAIHTRKEASNI